MNIILWMLQAVLAIHTAAGAVWKFSNAESAVPSLRAIPHGVWTAMGVLELLCAVCFIAPVFSKTLGWMVPLAALFVVAEMLLFCTVSFASGTASAAEIGYWLVVAAISGFVAYARVAMKPL